MQDELKVGDIVMLRSGGPSMTVAEFKGEFVTCAWFTNEGKLGTGNFPSGALELAEEDDGE